MAAERPPRVFISYSHDSDAHAARVLRLANDLRRGGVEAILDQYITSPPEGWPRWMDGHIRDADFVIMVCTDTYYRRVAGKEEPGEGLGVRWEGNLIYAHLYGSGVDLSRFVPVLTDGCRREHIPEVVRAASYYFIDKPINYDGLLRRLFNQPAAEMPPVGERPPLPTLAPQWQQRPPETKLKLLPPRYEPGQLSPTPQIEALLSFRTPLTKLYGAYESIAQYLVAWAQFDDQSRARFLCGPPGIGKSRVAAEAAFRLANSTPQWLSGFLPDTRNIEPHALCAYNSKSRLFIIIDNADGKVNEIRTLLSTLLEVTNVTLKILFLSRRPALWWQNDINCVDAAHICDSSDIPDKTLTIEEAAHLFHQVVMAVYGRMNKPNVVVDHAVVREWIKTDDVFHCRPLMIVATATHMAINDTDIPILSAKYAIQRLSEQEAFRIDTDGKRCQLSRYASYLLVVAAVIGRLSLSELHILSLAGFDLPPRDELADALKLFPLWSGKYIYPLAPDVLSASLVINLTQDKIVNASSILCWIEALVRRERLSDLIYESTLMTGQILPNVGIARSIHLLTDVAMLKNTSISSILDIVLYHCIANSKLDLYAVILLCSDEIVENKHLIIWHGRLNSNGGAPTPSLEVCRLCALAQLHLVKNDEMSIKMFGSLSVQACRLAMNKGLNELGGKILANVARAWAMKGNFGKATRAYKFAISYAEKLKLSEMVHNMMNDYHLIAMHQGKYIAARRRYDTLLKKLLRTSPTLLQERLRCQINRAICCDMLGEDLLALEQYKDTLQEAENNSLRRIAANCYANMGHIYVMRGDFAQAEEMLDRALQDAGTYRLLDIQSGVLHTIGLLSLLKNDISQAKVCGKKAYDIAARLSSDSLKCPAFLLMTEAYLAAGELDLARRNILYCKNHGNTIHRPMIELMGGIVELHYYHINQATNSFTLSVEFSERILHNNRRRIYRILYTKAIALAGLWLTGNAALEVDAKSSRSEAIERYTGLGATLHARKLYSYILRVKCINKELANEANWQ